MYGYGGRSSNSTQGRISVLPTPLDHGAMLKITQSSLSIQLEENKVAITLP